MKISVYGPGCARCKQTEKVVRLVVEAAGIPAEVEKVSDFQAMARLGVLSTPAVTVDGVLKCSGRIPGEDEVRSWLQAAISSQA
jgi:small redox-active disulfide protein 2